MIIKNSSDLASSPARKLVLDLAETALESIQPQNVLPDKVKLSNHQLQIGEKTYDLQKYSRIFLLGFGKGSAAISKILEDILGNKLTAGNVIDVKEDDYHFKKLNFTLGTHPLPSETNVNFTHSVIEQFNNLTVNDLILVVICGGGSAMFTDPKILLETLINANKELLRSGANIAEMNTLRKHLDSVKGGGLVKTFYPALVVGLIFSDVPGNNLSTIASGPTVKDPTTVVDATNIIEKYHLTSVKSSDLIETPKEDKYFSSVDNELVLSNLTALKAMETKARILGLETERFSDILQGEAREVGKDLINKINSIAGSHHLHEGKKGYLLLAGGETTVTVKGNGQGGRNQELVLGAISWISENQLPIRENLVIAAVGSDGWDNSPLAGALGDLQTLEKARNLKLDPESFLAKNDSFNFWQKVGDGITTGKLPSNVSDLMIVLKIN